MVRFSDMLGGNETPEEKPPVPSPPGAPIPVEAADDEADGADEADEDKSPEEVLERLTQYATSSRGADDAPPPEPAAAQETDASSFTPVGDDLLPRSKRRKGN